MPETTKKILTNTIIWGVVTGAVYEAFFKKFDRAILTFIQRHHWTGLQKFSTALAHFFSTSHWSELGILCLIVFFGLGLFLKPRQDLYPRVSRARLKFGFLGFSLLIAAIIAGLLKYGLARYRPEMLLEKKLYGFHFFSTQYENNSTPSGHTTLSFAGLLAIANLLKRSWITWLLVILGLVIGLSRVVLSAHYTSDVILGIYIGTISVYWVKSVREW